MYGERGLMRATYNILLAFIIGCSVSCSTAGSGGDSPVVPMPSPPIAQGFPIVVDFEELDDGPINGPVEVDGVEVDGANAEVQKGEVIISVGELEVTAPKNFRQAMLLVQEMDGYSSTIMELLDKNGNRVYARGTGAPGGYCFELLDGGESIVRTVRVRGEHAGVKKMILSNPLGDIEFKPIKQIPSWNASHIAIADFNNDNSPDVAVANTFSAQVMVFMGNGEGAFFDPIILPIDSLAADLVAVDVDGNGLTDLAALGDGVTIFLSTGAGFTNAGYYPTNSNSHDMAFGDFDGDTLPDIAVATGAGLYLISNLGSGIFDVPLLFNDGTVRDVRTVDIENMNINGDPVQDIVIGNVAPSQEVEVLLGDGLGGFTSNGTYPLTSDPVSLAIAKFSLSLNDYPDVAVLMAGTPNWKTFVSDGDGALLDHQEFQATGAATAFVMADINNDGFADAAIMDTDNNQLAVFISYLGSFKIAHRVALDASPVALAVGNINNDGKVDLIYSNILDEVWFYENTSQ